MSARSSKRRLVERLRAAERDAALWRETAIDLAVRNARLDDARTRLARDLEEYEQLLALIITTRSARYVGIAGHVLAEAMYRRTWEIQRRYYPERDVWEYHATPRRNNGRPRR